MDMENIVSELKEIKDLLKEVLSKRLVEDVCESIDDSTICIGTTGKGKKCTNKRIDGSDYCGMHGGNKKRKVSVNTAAKTEKIIPVHTHHTEPEKPCDVCIQHGDVLDPRVSDASYSLQERLAGMLKND
jgi:hypothetical protein